MDQDILIDVAISVAASVFFAFCRTVADNRDRDKDGQLTGWPLLYLACTNCVLGMGVGLIAVPAIRILHSFIPQVQIDRSWYVIASSWGGWVGLPKVMKALEREAKEKLKGGHSNARDTEIPGGSHPRIDRPRDPDPVQADPEPKN